MNTEIIQIDPGNIDSDGLAFAAEVIRRGGLVAFPTETVYGLGGDAKNPDAAKKIYAAKGRPSDNPLIVHIAEVEQMAEVAAEVPKVAGRLAEAFWPGPMTLILPKNDIIPRETTGGLSTVAVRLPSHPVARELIRQSGTLIAAPSANISGRPSPTRAAHVIEDLSGKVDCIIDGDMAEIGLESTIIDLTEPHPVILRPGYISLEDVKAVAGEARLDPGLFSEDGGTPPKAPGMRYRHYAPKGSLVIVEGQQEEVISEINRLCRESEKDGQKTAVLASAETAEQYACDHIFLMGSTQNEEEIAHNLYAALRELDAQKIEQIYSESFATPHMGEAIMNRLLKAAGHQVIKISEKD